MIVERSLTPEEMKESQRKYLNASYFSSCSGVFNSGTIYMLLAMALGLSGEFSSLVGTFSYVSYLFLPMGFVFSARMGACGNMILCRSMMAVCCFLMVLSGVVPSGAKILFITGVTVSMLFSSASQSMIFPLQKNIISEKDLPVIMQKTSVFNSCSVIVGTLLVAYVLKGETSPMKISMVILPAIFFLLFSCRDYARIKEPSILRKMAARPMWKDVRLSLRNTLMRKQLLTGFVLNLFLATVLQVNVVTAKKGLHISDSHTMLLTIICSACAIGAAFAGRSLCQKIGPRNTMLCAYPLYWLFPLSWILIPDGAPWYAAAVPFALYGLIITVIPMMLGIYFMISIPNRLQIGGTFLIFIVTGGLMGVTGMLLNPLFFRIAKCFAELDSMAGFHCYFWASGIFFLPGFLSVLNLPVKYRDYRKTHKKLPE